MLILMIVLELIREKKHNNEAPINAGYMVSDPMIFDYIEGSKAVFERYPMEKQQKMVHVCLICIMGFGSAWILNSSKRCLKNKFF